MKTDSSLSNPKNYTRSTDKNRDESLHVGGDGGPAADLDVAQQPVQL